MTNVAKHIDHVSTKAGGIDPHHMGSILTGSVTAFRRLKDPSQYPNLILELLELGYSEEDIRRVYGGNG